MPPYDRKQQAQKEFDRAFLRLPQLVKEQGDDMVCSDEEYREYDELIGDKMSDPEFVMDLVLELRSTALLEDKYKKYLPIINTLIEIVMAKKELNLCQ